MQAVLYTRYGSPDVLQFQEVSKPIPKENDVLIKVLAAATNPLDWHFMRGDPFFMRFMAGLTKPKNPKLGVDFAGRVEAVGKNVTRFKVGDEVFGSGDGAFAEYLCIVETKIAPKPAHVSFEQAAAVPIAAVTALQGLRDAAKLKAGQRVLVNGASGGVGTFAVQIAKAYGAHVTGVCSTRNLDLVRSIGADQVIDYTQTDFTKQGKTYDVILDMIGNHSMKAFRQILSDHGVAVIGGFSSLSHLIFQVNLMGRWINARTNKTVISLFATMKPQDLQVLHEMLENGTIKSVIDRTFPFSQTAEAIRYLETGRARGKVVVVM